MRSLVILLVLLSLTACNTTRQTLPKLSYPTQSIREMWSTCSMQLQLVNPTMPLLAIQPLCDCYVDFVTDTLSLKELENLSTQSSKELGLLASKQCPIQPKQWKPRTSQITS